MNKDNMKNVLRDPLRVMLMAKPCKKGMLALGAALMAVYYVLVLKLAGAMEGAAVIAAAGTLGAALLTAFAFDALKKEDVPVIVLLCVAAMGMLSVGAHLALLDIKPGRYGKVLEPLMYDMWNYDLLSAMAWEDGSWSGVYLMICALLSRIETFYHLYAFKLVDMLCQCMAACAVLRLALLRGTKVYGALAAMFAALLVPTMLMNAGIWAHCDATFAMFTLWGLVLLLDDHPMAGCLLWGVALATKLQSAFLFPLLIVLFMNEKVQLRHMLALVVAFFACHAAILIDGQGVMNVITRYAMQLDDARWGSVGLSDNMPGAYSLMLVASVREFSGMGLYLGIASALLVVTALLRAKKPLGRDCLLLAGLLLACGLPLVLPQMNARSLYLAILLGFAAASNARRLMAVALLEFVSLCAYMKSIFNTDVFPMMALSLLAIAAAVLVLLELVKSLRKEEPLA